MGLPGRPAPRQGPPPPRDWRPAAPPGPERPAGGVAGVQPAAGTSRAWSAFLHSAVQGLTPGPGTDAPCSPLAQPLLRPRPPGVGGELPSERDTGPRGVPVSLVGSSLSSLTPGERTQRHLQLVLAHSARDWGVGPGSGWDSFAGSPSLRREASLRTPAGCAGDSGVAALGSPRLPP